MKTVVMVLLLAGCHGAVPAANGTIAGAVVVGNEPDLGGLTVSLIGPTIRTTTTASDGTYEFAEVVPSSDSYRLIASADWTSETTLEQKVVIPSPAAPLPFVFSPLGRLVGSVVDAAGQPIGGARIVDDVSGAVAVSDATGAFEWATLAAGTHAITVTAAGYAPSVAVTTEAHWRMTTTLAPIVLAPSANAPPAHFLLEVRRVGRTDHSGATATLQPGGASATSSSDGTIDLGVIGSAIYQLTIVHPDGEIVFDSVYIGNGQAFVFTPSLKPLGIVTLDWGRRVGAVQAVSHRGDYVLHDDRVYALTAGIPSPAPVLDLGAAGIKVADASFLDDDTWLIVEAESSGYPASPRYSVYALRTSDWQITWLAEVDELARSLSAQHALLIGTPISGSVNVEATLVYLDSRNTVPLGQVPDGTLTFAAISPSGNYLVLQSVGAPVVRLTDGLIVGAAGGQFNGATWLWFDDLVLYRNTIDGTYHGFRPSDGTTIDYGDALPSGAGWTATDNNAGWGAFEVVPFNGIVDASRTDVVGTLGNRIVDWKVATGVATTLVDGPPGDIPHVEQFYDHERRAAYYDNTNGVMQLALLDCELGAHMGLGSYTNGSFKAARDWVVYKDGEGALWRASYDGSAPLLLHSPVAGVSVHPNGTKACAWQDYGPLYLIDLTTNDTVQVADSVIGCGWYSPTLLFYVRLPSGNGVDTGSFALAVQP